MNKKFTLIELLVVIAIIGILSSILIPSLSRAREKGKRAVCLSNLKQLGICFMLYEEAYDENLVSWEADESTHWPLLLVREKLLDSLDVNLCPSHTVPEENGFTSSTVAYKNGELFGSYGYNNALEESRGIVEKVYIESILDPTRLPLFMEAAWPDAGWPHPTDDIPADLSYPITGVREFRRSALAVHTPKNGNYVFGDGSARSIDIRNEIKSLLWNHLFE
ncbi:MAG: prepilin-type N-terminal cleavage/methylation domain-containing protein [Lentisphaeraceae bacterium]|nr:prepilin-type N-terminal cleavage/methylation domain-containing protein [Lentisphaeraceae bacterium]